MSHTIKHQSISLCLYTIRQRQTYLNQILVKYKISNITYGPNLTVDSQDHRYDTLHVAGHVTRYTQCYSTRLVSVVTRCV